MGLGDSMYKTASTRMKPDFLKEHDLDGDPFTIAGTSEVSYTKANGDADPKIAVAFKELIKAFGEDAPKLELNFTQYKAMEQNCGEINAHGDWDGKKVVLGIGSTKNPAGQTVPTIVVGRYKPPKAEAAKPKATAPDDDEDI